MLPWLQRRLKGRVASPAAGLCHKPQHQKQPRAVPSQRTEVKAGAAGQGRMPGWKQEFVEWLWEDTEGQQAHQANRMEPLLFLTAS